MIGVGLGFVIGGAVLIGIDGTSTGEKRISGIILYEQYRTTMAGGAVLLGLGAAIAIAGFIWLLLHRRRSAGSESNAESASLELSPQW